ncbi:MAG: CPBP family intramembrane metalloprotease [Candidatus Bathyarchaeota archaeon]|nr:CPBP family intramembrane metalloprotease [Candidatus Bathyarchaeota archaeon]
MASKKFGERKGPFIVWLFVTLYFARIIAFRGSSNGTLPQDITISVVLSLLISMAINWGVILAFLVIFLSVWERRRSLRNIFSSVGLRTKGSVKSLSWSIALFPLCIAIGFIIIVLSYFLGPIQSAVSNNGQIPLWYLWYLVIYSFFPVAVIEEALARGYMLDRLIPQHPSSLVKALPAILLSSLLFTLWHVPSYLNRFPAPWIAARLAGNVFPISIVLSIAYVKAGTRNITGPILIHFLLDSIPIILLLV